jgi:hypothetical protein
MAESTTRKRRIGYNNNFGEQPLAPGVSITSEAKMPLFAEDT